MLVFRKQHDDNEEEIDEDEVEPEEIDEDETEPVEEVEQVEQVEVAEQSYVDSVFHSLGLTD